MSAGQKTIVAAAFLLVLAGIGAADAVLTRGEIRYPGARPEDEGNPEAVERSGGVRKRPEPEVFAVLSGRGISTDEAREQSLLQRVAPAAATVSARTLMQGGDRLALFAYIASPEAKTAFLALKSALAASFSPEVRDLADETRSPPDRRVHNVLRFADPALSTEHMLFLRVGERLYEFHYAPEKAGEIEEIVRELAR